MNKKSYILQLIGYFTFFFTLIESRKLVYVQSIFRHGARYPIRSMENDLSNFNQLQYGELTSQGKHMHYILGKAMYDKYWKELFGGTEFYNKYDQSQIYVKSTNVNRTIQSAQSQIQGIMEKIPPLELPISQLNFSLPPFANSIKFQQEIKNQSVFPVFGSLNRNFHTVPIHTDKSREISSNQKSKYRSNPYDQGDFLAKFDIKNCPNQKFWSKQNMASKDALKIKNSQKVKRFLSQLSRLVSKSVKFEDASHYINEYQCSKHLGKPYLALFDNQQYLKTSYFVKLTSNILKIFYNEDQIKTSNTQLLQNTLFRMKQAKNRNGPRLVLFSGHDNTLMSILTAFNMNNIPCIMDIFFNGANNFDTCLLDYPQFASTIILQLWQQDNLSHSIKILYNGVERKIPICNYQYSCSFAEFESWANQFYIENPNEVCGIREQQYTKFYIIIGVLSFFILIFVIIEMSKKFKQKKWKKMQKMQEKKGYTQNFDDEQGDKQSTVK